MQQNLFPECLPFQKKNKREKLDPRFVQLQIHALLVDIHRYLAHNFLFLLYQFTSASK